MAKSAEEIIRIFMREFGDGAMLDLAIINLKMIAERKETRFKGVPKAEEICLNEGILLQIEKGLLVPTSKEIREQILSIEEENGRIKFP